MPATSPGPFFLIVPHSHRCTSSITFKKPHKKRNIPPQHLLDCCPLLLSHSHCCTSPLAVDRYYT